jgi:DNA mismatch endonuclease (patch repair protein)
MRKRTKEQISFNMSRIRASNTKPELLLRSALWKRNFRYKLHYKITGKPDIVFPRYKLAIFCDGEFWHGKNFEALKKEIKTNRSFWLNKIGDNIKRDRKNNRLLRRMGWYVLRFWNRDIKMKTENCVAKIVARIESNEHN